MNLVAITSILSIVIHTALASMGTITFCQHDDGDLHRIISATHEEESHNDCCHHDESSISGESAMVHDCDSCVDTVVDTKDIDKAAYSNARTIIKAAVEQVIAPFELADFIVRSLAPSDEASFSRSLAIRLSPTAVHIETTVLRI